MTYSVIHLTQWSFMWPSSQWDEYELSPLINVNSLIRTITLFTRTQSLYPTVSHPGSHTSIFYVYPFSLFLILCVFSLLRHSWEKGISSKLLCSRIGEFTYIFFVINTVSLGNKLMPNHVTGCSMSKVNWWKTLALNFIYWFQSNFIWEKLKTFESGCWIS